MLRTTISRIRKVCSIAFIPRILRGDQRSTAVSSAVIRKVHKSTNSTGDGENTSTAESKDVPKYTFTSAAELKIDNKIKKKISESIVDLGDKTTDKNTTNQPVLTSRLPLTHHERCQRIVDQAFGKADNTQHDRVLSEQYFSHTVNLEDTRRAIHESETAKLRLQEQKIRTDYPLVADDRSQYSIFKMSRELNLTNDNCDEILITDSASTKEPEVIESEVKNLENIKGITKETPPVEEPNLPQAKEDFDKCVNNPEIEKSIEKKALCDDDAETIEVVKDERNPDLHLKTTPTYQPHIPWFLNATTARKPQLSYAKEDHEEDWVDNKESVAKKALCDDTKTIKLVRDEIKHQEATPSKQLHIPQVPNSTTAKEEEELLIKLALHQEATPSNQLHTPQVLNSTTAKQEEELLTQKLETIEETPIVEAQKPKLEGFNVTPRVLGDEYKLKSKVIENNQDNSSKVDLPGALDEVSKRCLNCPLGQIDEMLINEMEKFNMTCKTAQKASSTPLEDDLVQMNVLNKQPNSTTKEQEIHSESPELEKENTRATDSWIPDVNKQADALRKSEEIVKPTGEKTHDVSHPDYIHTQLKQLACKSQEHNSADDYNSTKKFACSHIPPTRQAAEIEENKQEIEETLRAPINMQIREPYSLDRPLLKRPLSETTNSHACINNQNTEPYSIKSNEGNVLSETAQNAQTASAAVEAENTSAKDFNTKVTSFNPPSGASNSIRQERLLKPEYRSYFKGVNGTSYNSTMDASKSRWYDKRAPTESEFFTNPMYSRSVADAYVWGQHQNGTVSKYRHVHLTLPKESDAVEHDGQTPIRQSTTKAQGELEERQTTANITIFVKVPSTKFSLPGEDSNKKNECLPTEKSQLEPKQDSENTSLPDEILKRHTLDPYYVLTCNETCPISPGSMSAYQNSEFVDTSETLYMKKNICESIRPNPRPIAKCANMSSQTMPNAEVMSDINATSMPNAVENMPKLGEQMALSDLLKRVRDKSRLAYSAAKSGLTVQAVGKCGSKAPRCAPAGPRSPPNDPVPPPSFGLPKLKRRPPVCKPLRKPSHKCSCATNDRGGLFPIVMPYDLDEPEVCAVRSNVSLTDDVIYRLQNLGKVLGEVVRQAKPNFETLLAKDYEPWTPIPSIKTPQKAEKTHWRPGTHGLPPCVEGCPVFPKARASMNPEPPCNNKPCEGFPKRRSFSMLDCFAVSLGENKVYDLGDF